MVPGESTVEQAVANNLHISYDLHAPGQNYDRLIAKIKTLGAMWAKIHYSFWYVNSPYTAEQAVAVLKTVLDPNDKVYVVDATNNAAAWNQIAPDVGNLIKEQWLK
jgi:hypothetical protein